MESNDATAQARIQAILASGIKIPPLPQVLQSVHSLLADPDAGPQEVAQVIRQDGAMSGAVFRVVGSPVFGLRAKVNTLEHAINLLGVPPTLSILRGLALRQAFTDPQHQGALESLWQRSGQVAEFSMALVRQLRIKGLAADRAYTVGMFHDCGLALLLKRFPAYAQALAGPVWPDVQALDDAADTDHAVAGEQVAKNWQLPEEVTHVIRHHHDASPPPEVAPAVALLTLACYIHQQNRQAADPGWEAHGQPLVQAVLGLDEADVLDAEMEVRMAVGL